MGSTLLKNCLNPNVSGEDKAGCEIKNIISENYQISNSAGVRENKSVNKNSFHNVTLSTTNSNKKFVEDTVSLYDANEVKITKSPTLNKMNHKKLFSAEMGASDYYENDTQNQKMNRKLNSEFRKNKNDK